MEIIFVASSIAWVMIFFIRRVTNPCTIVVAQPTVTPTAATVNTSTTSSPARGIDSEVLSSSPIFAYSASSDHEKLDCAVCLSRPVSAKNRAYIFFLKIRV